MPKKSVADLDPRSKTLLVRVDGGPEQRLSFAAIDFANVAQATSTEVAAAINAAIIGGKASSRHQKVICS